LKRWTFPTRLFTRTIRSDSGMYHWIIEHLCGRARARPNISDSLRKHICLRANTPAASRVLSRSLQLRSGTQNVSGTVCTAGQYSEVF
jgi:hypothetical protein